VLHEYYTEMVSKYEQALSELGVVVAKILAAAE